MRISMKHRGILRRDMSSGSTRNTVLTVALVNHSLIAKHDSRSGSYYTLEVSVSALLAAAFGVQ